MENTIKYPSLKNVVRSFKLLGAGVDNSEDIAVCSRHSRATKRRTGNIYHLTWRNSIIRKVKLWIDQWEMWYMILYISWYFSLYFCNLCNNVTTEFKSKSTSKISEYFLMILSLNLGWWSILMVTLSLQITCIDTSLLSILPSQYQNSLSCWNVSIAGRVHRRTTAQWRLSY
jgi:hypothetical protein